MTDGQQNTKDAFTKWTDAYHDASSSGTELLWPSETLVRCFKGSYVPGLDRNYTGKSVLDVSFGGGNNLVFLNSLGLQLHGTEVTQEICHLAAQKFKRMNLQAELKVGTNRDLPYPDATFDFLVSWNVVHYENTEANVRAAIAEYFRVLKPGGRLFLSSTGPDHLILKGARTVGQHGSVPKKM